MNNNIFFERKGPFLVSNLFNNLKIKKKIYDIKNLTQATKNDLTFFDNVDYAESAKNTKALFCLTTLKLKNYLPKYCEPVLVKNVLFELCKITKKFYPDADIDFPDFKSKI